MRASKAVKFGRGAIKGITHDNLHRLVNSNHYLNQTEMNINNAFFGQTMPASVDEEARAVNKL
jgi:hypothetical protein